MEISNIHNRISEVKEIFAQVTRYPIAILDTTAHLEEDLGIDSVKLGEVFAALREKYQLPEDMELTEEQIITIEAVAKGIESFIHTPAMAYQDEIVSNPQAIPNREPISKVSSNISIETVLDEVLNIFTKITRYPREILDPDAHLEEDLGIDSVKLGEIFAEIRVQKQLPEDLQLKEDQIQTIHSIAKEIYEYLDSRSLVIQKDPLPHKNKVNNQIYNSLQSKINDLVVSTPDLLSKDDATVSLSKPLQGKVAFISGSGRGIGRAIASHLSNLGAEVIVNSFHSREEGVKTANNIKEQGGKAIHIWGSMAHPEQQKEVFKQIEERYGYLDFFISNASNGMLTKFEDITPEHWEKAFRTNIIGLQQGSLMAVALMKKRGGGKIITLSSPASHGYVNYFGCMSAVKAAVESLTRTMAVEYSKYNVQVNCVSPGPVYGGLLDKWPDSDQLIQQWEENSLTDTLCNAEDVAHFIAYLLQDEVKMFTGSILTMDGGISIPKY